MAARLRDRLAGQSAGHVLREVAHTLRTGRVEWGVRVAVVAHDLAELVDLLDEFAASGVRPQLPPTELGQQARHWAEGGTLDRAAHDGADRPRRISLPTYPFAGERHWIPGAGEEPRDAALPTAVSSAAVSSAAVPSTAVPPAAVPVPPVAGLLTAPHWVRSAAVPGPAAGRAAARVLIVARRTGVPLAAALAEHYRRSGALDVVECPLGGPYPLDGPAPDRVHLVAGAASVGPQAEAEHELALLRLVKALAQVGSARRTDLFVVTQDTQAVSGEPSGWHGAGLAGLAYFAARDAGRFAVRNLDVSGADLTTPDSLAQLAALVAAEPPAPGGELVALRGGHRYRVEVRPVDLQAPADRALPGIRRGGKYVVVGGSGSVGRVVSRHLLDQHAAEVICIGRRPQSDPAVREALADGRVGYLRADVTDPVQARQVMAEAKAALGQIHGVLFAGATAITDVSGALGALGEDEFREHFDIKSAGGRHVYEAVAQEPLDFLCYFSSAQAFAFGGAGTHAAYAAGITFADAFARAVGRTSAFPVGIVNWGAWRASFGEAAGDFPMLGFLDDEEGAACFTTAVQLLRGGATGRWSACGPPPRVRLPP